MRIDSATIFSIAILFLFQNVHSGTTHVNIQVRSQSYVYQRIGIYEKKEVPFKNEIDPYGTWIFNFTSQSPGAQHSTEFLILTAKEYHNLGVKIGYNNYLCCTKTLKVEGYCNKTEYLAYDKYNDPKIPRDSFHYTNVSWTNNNGSMIAQFPFTRYNLTGGLWYLVALNCGPTSYQMVGVSSWRNPYGWTIGQEYPMLFVSPLMMILFILLTFYWIFMCVKYRKDIMGLQIAIGIVCGLSALSNAISFGVNMKYNKDGLNDHVFNSFNAFFTSLQLTMSRVLLLLVCIGYTITKKKLTKLRIACIALLGGLYFAAVASEAFVQNSSKDGSGVSTLTLSLLSVFIIFTNAIIMIWCCIELVKTIQKLRRMKEEVKKNMYKKLAIIMIIAFAVSAILYFMEYILTIRDGLDGIWKGEFFFQAYWEFAFFVIITSIATIWKPSSNNKRFAYSQQLPDTDPRESRRDRMEEDSNREEMAVIEVDSSEMESSGGERDETENSMNESQEEDSEDED